jgi:hypothetical protein
MDRDETIYQRPLHEQDLAGLVELCTNVARNLSANSRQSDTAHALRAEWLRLSLDHSLDGARISGSVLEKAHVRIFIGRTCLDVEWIKLKFLTCLTRDTC